MGKLVTAFCLGLCTTVAHASTVRFDCHTTLPVDKGFVRMSFTLMETRNQVGYVTNDADIPVKVAPLTSQISELNDNYLVTFERDAHGIEAIHLWGEGCSSVTMTLFKSLGYRSGVVTVEGSGDCYSDSFASPVSCKITLLN